MKEVLKSLIHEQSLPDDLFLEQDLEFQEIFVEEVTEILEEIEPLIQQWISNPDDREALVNIRRNFHTLKGSGRMVGATHSGEMAWTVEDTLNRVISGTLPLSKHVQQFVCAVIALYRHKLLHDFAAGERHQIDLRPMVMLGQQIQQNSSIEPALEELLDLAERLTHAEQTTGLEIIEVAASEEEVAAHLDDVVSAPEVESEQVEEVEDPTTAEQLEPTPEAVQETTTTPSGRSQGADIDQELYLQTLTIFMEESSEHLEKIKTFLESSDRTSDQYNGLIRALHTLRGSSAMAHIEHVFQTSSLVENLFKGLAQDHIDDSSSEFALLVQYEMFVRQYLAALALSADESKLDSLYEQFNRVWNAYKLEHSDADLAESANGQGLVSNLIELDINDLLDAELDFETRLKEDGASYLTVLIEQAQTLQKNTTMFATQGLHDLSEALGRAYSEVLAKPALLNNDHVYELFEAAHQYLIQLFDILASGQRVILTQQHTEVLTELNDYVHQDIDEAVNEVADDDIAAMTDDAEFIESIDQETVTQPNGKSVEVTSKVSANEPVATSQVDIQQILFDKSLTNDARANGDFDPDLLDIFLEEADELLSGIDNDLNQWQNDPDDTNALKNLMRYLHTVKGGANMVQATFIGLIAHELETIYERLIQKQLQSSPAFIQQIRFIQDNLSDRVQTLRDQLIDYPADQTLMMLRHLAQAGGDTATLQSTVASPAPAAQAVEDVAPTETDHIEEIEIVSVEEEQVETAEELQEAEDQREAAALTARAEMSDEDLVHSIVMETFHEESAELFTTAEKLMRQWAEDRQSRSTLLQLQRTFHSLKGAARMAEQGRTAEIAYLLEGTFEKFGLYNFTASGYDELIKQAISWLRIAVFEEKFNGYDGLMANLQSIQYDEKQHGIHAKLSRSEILLGEQRYEVVQGDGTEPPSMFGEFDKTDKEVANNEMIRIPADVIEKMIDLAGENSINRSRIEMDLGLLGNTLTEMEQAIHRLADQLRRMEGELETQIIAKHEGENARYAEFDPLEMDQYSSINQLSKSLAESASDLVDFKATIAEKLRDTEGLLLQQSRIQTEIQQGLMSTRLVPFSRMLPRLQRIVRQTASTLNKPTDFIVNNTEGELDRTILERLVSPLEHMLRNAVDHGIEETSERERLGKPTTGRIELSITRQGTDVLVSFTDDGKGINTEAVRNKALSVGLIQADQQLSDYDIMQLIFNSGLSTASQVTQISGRGVGLDVVQSEIKALGGDVSVQSALGQGTTFTIRVPTTVAVSDALMVKIFDQQFAVPLPQIERIIRLSPRDIEAYFQSEDEQFSIDGQHYKLRYLGEFVANHSAPNLAAVETSLPVLLMKASTGQSVAVVVDQLIGSRGQIVMKPIGQQFASIGLVAGATILADGNVCLILDGQAVIRQISSTLRPKVSHLEDDLAFNEPLETRTIMVVDDSVTVRKVTSRLLERHGYQVITAKDGVDAMEILETASPHLMLLDIEMPRMDGFEVTNLVRHHARHKDLPIIMITSRTGEKHRERAMSLGATMYMGKPFQEAELVTNIDSILALN